jgi:glycosyltransferase involved in cell wall biosynthesis
MVLPIFNEKESLPILIPKIIDVISCLSKNYEVILVDDGSTDGTREVALDIVKKFPNIKYIRLKTNYGLSTALALGYNRCLGKIVVTMDSDLQYDPLDIPKLLEKLDKYDLVCGWRYNRHDHFLKRISSKIANFIRNKILNDNFHDIGCIFRAFHRECLKNIRLFDGFHRFLPILFVLQGFKVIEVKINHFPRKYGRSKFNIRNRIFNTFFDMLVIKWIKQREINYEVAEEVN